MTPAESFEKIIPIWRASMPPEQAADVDAFVSRHRDELIALVGEMMAIARAKRGLRPRSVPEFLAYQTLAARDEAKDAESDDHVARRLLGRIERMRDDDDYEAARVYGPTFAEMRALAILLRGEEWAAVPLMLRRPALALGKRLEDGPVVLAVVDAVPAVVVPVALAEAVVPPSVSSSVLGSQPRRPRQRPTIQLRARVTVRRV